MRCLLGLDDTDSSLGHCTTHLGFRIVGDLMGIGSTFRTYPRLVRLNPNIPFKTRGNAAVCLEFETGDPEGALQIAEARMRRLSDVENGANSGLVFLDRPMSGDIFRSLYLSALSGVVSYKKALGLLRASGVRHVVLGNGMGVVGAAASLGFAPDDDHTYELIAYRSDAACGTPRQVVSDSVRMMERVTFPHTFNSYDHGSRRVLITPHGPDPVFFGIRADSPHAALSASRMVDFEERLAGHMIYLTNQCTDAHLTPSLGVPMKAYSAGWIEGAVEQLEKGQGGHLYLDLRTGHHLIRGAVYRPAADLGRAAAMLEKGDVVRVFGGVRRATSNHPPVLNVEKVEVLSVGRGRRWANPSCANCGRRAKSEGTGKGFQCRGCGARFTERARRAVRYARTIAPGIYVPSSGSQRHLTKPLVRYGYELHGPHSLIEGWYELGASELHEARAQSPRSGLQGPLSPLIP